MVPGKMLHSFPWRPSLSIRLFFLAGKETEASSIPPYPYPLAKKGLILRLVQRCLFANRLSLSELFDDILLVLNVKRLCMVLDSRISSAKVCDCVISA